jgi:hypothetical protein
LRQPCCRPVNIDRPDGSAVGFLPFR